MILFVLRTILKVALFVLRAILKVLLFVLRAILKVPYWGWMEGQD